jgi:hypothetical protein
MLQRVPELLGVINVLASQGAQLGPALSKDEQFIFDSATTAQAWRGRVIRGQL